MTYAFSVENLRENYPSMEHLFRAHYAEMCERLERDGFQVSPYNPRLEDYFAANERGDLMHFVVRHDGEPVGYSNIYVTRDMHNQDLIAQEDTIFISKPHRNGVGRKFSLQILAALRAAGVKRLCATALTDLRVAKLWARMGFKHTAHHMTYFF